MNKRIVIEIDEGLYQGIKGTDFEFARKAVRSFQATIADAIRKGIPLDAEVTKIFEDVKAEIEDIDGITEIGAQILDEVLGIINRKIKEIKHD